MSPRRPIVNRVLIPQRTRRGRGTGGEEGGDNLLLVTAPAPAQFSSRIAGGGATVRLRTADGEDVFLPGVPVTISLPLGSAATLTATPVATVLTDSSGVATFTSLTLSGTAGTYSLEFSAPGYTSAISTGHVLVAGVATAANSIATVPSGRIGSQTVVFIRLRDADNNELQVAGTAAVTVTVTGANPVPQSTVGFGSGVGYRFAYTPTVVGTDTLTIRYSGTQIGGSPYTSIVSGATGGFTSNSLRVCLNSNMDLGALPGVRLLGTGPRITSDWWDTREPIFRAAQGYLNPTNLTAAIDVADDQDVLLVAVFPGTTNSYSDVSGTGDTKCIRYNDTKFKDGVATFANRSAITSALARRRLVWYMFDEPWHSHYCGTFTTTVLRDAYRHVKSIWPNCIIVSRIEPQYMRGGWGGSGTLPVNYFDKLDYSWATYRGSTRSPSSGQTPRQYFQSAKTTVNSAGYGVMYAHNWVNLGDEYCWQAFGPGDTRQARIHGDSSRTGQSAVIEACSIASSDNLWAEDPGRIIEVCQAAALDPDCPAVFCYQHPGNSGIVNSAFKTYLKRADFLNGWVSAIQAGEARPTFNGWRDPK